MNWKQEAKNDLYKLRKQQQALVSIPEQIAALREDIASTKGSGADSAPVQGGGNSYEDRILNNIVKRDKLIVNYHIVCRQVRAVEAALVTLDGRQRRALELFYIDKQTGAVERLAGEHNVTDRQAWRIIDQALYDFTVALYGIHDS